MKLTYFAYPIDQNDGNAALIDLVDQTQMEMRRHPELFGAFFDPGDGFSIVSVERFGKDNTAIADINRMAAMRADTVVAFLPAGVATVGVPMEIDRAAAAGKAVIIVTDIEVGFMLNYDLPNVRLVALGPDAPVTVVSMLKMMYDTVMQDFHKVQQSEPLPFKLLDDDARMPTRAHADDAGFDLYTVGNHEIAPGEFIDIPTGVAMELPPGVWAMLTARSSTWRDLRVTVQQGIIDTGYRGPLFVGVHNPGNLPVQIAHGRRLGQIILMGNFTEGFAPLQVSELSPSMRGSNGFGSSGS